MFETNASTIASLVHGEPKESVPGRAEWGKRFEETYGWVAHIAYDVDFTTPEQNLKKRACRHLKEEGWMGCSGCGEETCGKCFDDLFQLNGDYYHQHCMLNLFDREMQTSCGEEGKTMARQLLEHGIVGNMPRALQRQEGNYAIWAKPDLCLGEYKLPVEIKTYPLNDYCRTIGSVMSWVWEEPLLLVGFREGKLEKETIDGKGFDILSVPKEAWEEREYADDEYDDEDDSDDKDPEW